MVPFCPLAPLLKPNSRKKGTLISMRLLRNKVTITLILMLALIQIVILLRILLLVVILMVKLTLILT